MISKEMIKTLKEVYPDGTRIKLIKMMIYKHHQKER